MTTYHFTPSSWLLAKMIQRAEAALDHQREQEILKKEALSDDRCARALAAEVNARKTRRLFGDGQ